MSIWFSSFYSAGQKHHTLQSEGEAGQAGSMVVGLYQSGNIHEIWMKNARLFPVHIVHCSDDAMSPLDILSTAPICLALLYHFPGSVDFKSVTKFE